MGQLGERSTDGLVIAPHPYYPARCCLGHLLERHADLFDAVELNAFYTSQLDHFNRSAVSWARRVGKPIVANADVHRLKQLGSTFSLVDAAPEPNAICAAIREGRVEIRTRPLSFVEAVTHLAGLEFGDLKRLARGSAPRANQRVSRSALALPGDHTSLISGGWWGISALHSLLLQRSVTSGSTLCRPARRHVAGDERYEDEEHAASNCSQRIRGADTKQEAREKPRDDQ